MHHQQLPVHADEFRSNSSGPRDSSRPSFIHSSSSLSPIGQVPSIDLPLLSRATHATFARKTGISTQKGRVHPQRRTKDDPRQHPEFFYVEWPACSENFQEIHAPTLARITGHQAPAKHCFRLDEVAALLAAMHTIPVPALLHAARPK